MDKLKGNVKKEGAVIYVRVATKAQVGTDTCLENQKNICEQYAAKMGLTFLKTFEECAAFPINDDRKVFNDMLDFVNGSDEVGVIVYSFDRFSRNIPEALEVIEKLAAKGIKTSTVNQGDLFRLISLLDLKNL